MAPRSSALAWRTPGTAEPGGLPSMGSLRVTTERLQFHFHALEKELALHSSVLAWRIPGTGEPGGLPSMGLQSQTRLKRLSSSSDTLEIQWLGLSTFTAKGLGSIPDTGTKVQCGGAKNK